MTVRKSRFDGKDSNMTDHSRTPMRWMLAGLSLVVSSCLDITTTTTVHHDGTLTKTMTFSGDSTIIQKGNFPLRVDSTWQITRGRADNDKKMYATAERTFASTRELNAALRGNDLEHVTIETSLESTFQWFFTSYRYHETWKSYKQINEVPLSQYVDTSLIDIFYRHEILKEPFTSSADSVALKRSEGPYEEYRARNLFEAYYKEFMKGVRTLADDRLSPAVVEAAKEELFQRSIRHFSDSNLDTVKFIFAATLKNRRALSASDANATGFATLKERLDFENLIGSYGFKTTVIMPGIITSTNSRSLEGSSASWNDFIIMGMFGDIDLWVESQAVNWWAVILTGIIVAGILAYLIAAVVRARRV